MEFGGPVTIFLIIFISCLCIFSLWKGKQQQARLPPGPVPLPLIGNILQLERKAPFKALLRLSKKYGPVFTVSFGPRWVVVLCGYEAVKEALIDQGEDFSGREPLPLVKTFLKDYGIVTSNGERWKQLRRFSIMTLRNFGMGKKSIEKQIQEEAQFLVEEFRKTKELPFDPIIYLSQAVSNVICSIVFGDRFEYSNKKFNTLLSLLNENFSIVSSTWGELYNLFPNLMEYLPGPHNKFHENIRNLKGFVSEMIKTHEESLDITSPRDFIDSFLIKKLQEKDNPTSEFCHENLVASTLNLFFAGTETTSTTLRYGMLLLLKYPYIQEKVHEEIDSVIGHNRRPTMQDRMEMPYTDAVIHEIQRFIDLIPMNLPHCVLQDIQFRGYTIPKGTPVIPLLTSVHYDKTCFNDPETFNPGHFLDENGCFKKNDAFMPFSTGKRICLGKGLAQMELFLFFTTILQNFTLKSLVDPKEIDVKPDKSGFLNMPCVYQLCVFSH